VTKQLCLLFKGNRTLELTELPVKGDYIVDRKAKLAWSIVPDRIYPWGKRSVALYIEGLAAPLALPPGDHKPSLPKEKLKLVGMEALASALLEMVAKGERHWAMWLVPIAGMFALGMLCLVFVSLWQAGVISLEALRPR